MHVKPNKVNEVRIFLGPYCIMKRVLTLVLGVQESGLLGIICQNKVKILH